MKYDEELNLRLSREVDEEYAKFHSSLVPNSTILGVRIPTLRQIAKEFSKYDDFLENVSLNSYEFISIACYYIGLTTKDLKPLEERLNYILPYVDNWAICDTFVSSLKILKRIGQEFLPTVYKYLSSENDFYVRFAIVVLLSYYLQDDNLTNDILYKMVNLQDRNYYIDMAIAWLVSVAFVKQREKTLTFLANKHLNKTCQNKSISKICDSFRVTKADKELVKTFKIN